VDPPPRGASQALVKVRLVGLDGTDREISRGLYGELPEGEDVLIIGHESLGEVLETGGEVKGLRPGDMVVATVAGPTAGRRATSWPQRRGGRASSPR
jgi:threonine dehydrogenase-like Zn-dependent dehydrogenase